MKENKRLGVSGWSCQIILNLFRWCGGVAQTCSILPAVTLLRFDNDHFFLFKKAETFLSSSGWGGAKKMTFNYKKQNKAKREKDKPEK